MTDESLIKSAQQKVADAKCTYIQPDPEYGMRHEALQPGLCWIGRF